MGNLFNRNNKATNTSSLEENKKFPPRDNFELNEYFSLIKKKAEKISYENQRNKFNISFSLDKKDFTSPFIIKKYSVLEEKNYEYWKDYLNKYLQRRAKKGFDWANEVIK